MTETDCTLQNYGPWRKMCLSVVESTGHVCLVLEVTRDAFCFAGSGPAVRGIFPVSTASSWTVVMFEG